MTDEELKAIEARANAAQKGPWYVGYEDGSGAECGKEGACITALPDIPDAEDAGRMPIIMGGDLDGCPAGVLVPRDAVFIAYARDDVPRLVAEVRRLQAERENLRELVKKVRDYWLNEAHGKPNGWTGISTPGLALLMAVEK